MKSVLLSVKPKYCELIANGKKTIEIRKTSPKIEPPFKCYIYCTRQRVPGEILLTYDKRVEGRNKGFSAQWDIPLAGKVIGEFVCNKIDRIAHCGTSNNDIRLMLVNNNLFYKGLDYAFFDSCKLSYSDIDKYSNGRDVYAWHISNLKIYDKPKCLSEFSVTDYRAIRECPSRERIYVNPDYVNGACLKGAYICSEGADWCIKCKTKPLKRPPQSWCYVEEAQE